MPLKPTVSDKSHEQFRKPVRMFAGERWAAVKWWATELSFDVANACLQLHGGYGYTEECLVTWDWRDARPPRIGGGTTEIVGCRELSV